MKKDDKDQQPKDGWRRVLNLILVIIIILLLVGECTSQRQAEVKRMQIERLDSALLVLRHRIDSVHERREHFLEHLTLRQLQVISLRYAMELKYQDSLRRQALIDSLKLRDRNWDPRKDFFMRQVPNPDEIVRIRYLDSDTYEYGKFGKLYRDVKGKRRYVCQLAPYAMDIAAIHDHALALHGGVVTADWTTLLGNNFGRNYVRRYHVYSGSSDSTLVRQTAVIPYRLVNVVDSIDCNLVHLAKMPVLALKGFADNYLTKQQIFSASEFELRPSCMDATLLAYQIEIYWKGPGNLIKKRFEGSKLTDEAKMMIDRYGQSGIRIRYLYAANRQQSRHFTGTTYITINNEGVYREDNSAKSVDSWNPNDQQHAQKKGPAPRGKDINVIKDSTHVWR